MSFLLRQKCCHNKHMFVKTKHPLLQQKYVCCKKGFVATKVCLSQENFCHYKITCLSRQNICHYKHNFVLTSILLSQKAYFCHNKHIFLLWQASSCCNKRRVLSEQMHVYRDKSFVTREMILVAVKPVILHNICHSLFPISATPVTTRIFDSRSTWKKMPLPLTILFIGFFYVFLLWVLWKAQNLKLREVLSVKLILTKHCNH